jgi:hypothetical protein
VDGSTYLRQTRLYCQLTRFKINGIPFKREKFTSPSTSRKRQHYETFQLGPSKHLAVAASRRLRTL